VLTGLVGSIGAGACTVFDAEPVRDFPDASAGSGGTGGSGGSGGQGPPLTWFERINEHECRVVSAPRPDQAPDGSTDTNSKPEFFMAMSSIRLGYTGPAADDPKAPGHLVEDPDAFLDIGLDLDDKCSSSATCIARDAGSGGGEDAGDAGPPRVQERSCVPGSTAARMADGTYCRDNAVGFTIPISYNAGTTSGFFGVNENDWNCELHRGGFGVMFRIRDYNYLTNDPQVTVDIYNTMGIVEQPNWWCRGADVAPDMGQTTYVNWRREPAWRFDLHHWIYATSNWDEDTGSATSLPDSKVHTDTAYVKDGYLVAFLPPASKIGFIGKQSVIPGIRLVFERGVLVGRLVDHAENGWSLEDAALGGAVDPLTMIDSFKKIGYCKTIMCASFDLLEGILKGVVDINLKPEQADPEKPCDGMSIGMAIEAREAKGDGFRKEPEGDEFLNDCPRPRHPDMRRRYDACSCTTPDGGGEVSGCGDGGTESGTGGNGDGG
jgi:hypothetical protein